LTALFKTLGELDLAPGATARKGLLR
jgi:hypothetical protein